MRLANDKHQSVSGDKGSRTPDPHRQGLVIFECCHVGRHCFGHRIAPKKFVGLRLGEQVTLALGWRASFTNTCLSRRAVRIIAALVGVLFRKDDKDRPQQDFEVHKQRPLANVLMIALNAAFHFFKRISLTAIAVYLS